ncbi:SRPBCC family protein [Rhizobium jaguaris]|uniref:Carbon monoxide dehydrogenase n=1 Tax=Rhizobium jaguaris TaxID=1312183 RepID=A0A387FYQ6_9HYPH|nr:carbon monoxide dehydrogenase subunit G [Rhizobium jaguaris]AYG63503.1 carbon monoxide dehydrogenase [Rhizobium jaguaris]
MNLKGEYRIKASRSDVWAMINDPQVLKDCIPGCDSLDGSLEDGFTARVTTKIGPIKATFDGSVKLSNIQAPESYTISGEGKGGVAGFAKGGVDVHLAEAECETILSYTAKAQVGGKLAQLGARLIDSTAKKLADEFFASLAARASAPAAAEQRSAAHETVIVDGNPEPVTAVTAPAAAAPSSTAQPSASNKSTLLLIGLAVVVIAAVVVAVAIH